MGELVALGRQLRGHLGVHMVEDAQRLRIGQRLAALAQPGTEVVGLGAHAVEERLVGHPVAGELDLHSGDPVAQLSGTGTDSGTLDQLSDGDSSRALAQLDPVERQVLLDAVEGTDICENADNIPAIRELCERRIETRSAEFARNNSGGSAEDNLLGGGFDSARLATLQAVLTRLAGNTARPDDFADQAIASVALGQQDVLSGADATGAKDPGSDLSPETQAVVNAIVQQLGGG